MYLPIILDVMRLSARNNTKNELMGMEWNMKKLRMELEETYGEKKNIIFLVFS